MPCNSDRVISTTVILLVQIGLWQAGLNVFRGVISYFMIYTDDVHLLREYVNTMTI
jgi:hypothetical protein